MHSRPHVLQIDIFEQQFRSISNIDFMERYLNEVRRVGLVVVKLNTPVLQVS